MLTTFGSSSLLSTVCELRKLWDANKSLCWCEEFNWILVLPSVVDLFVSSFCWFVVVEASIWRGSRLESVWFVLTFRLEWVFRLELELAGFSSSFKSKNHDFFSAGVGVSLSLCFCRMYSWGDMDLRTGCCCSVGDNCCCRCCSVVVVLFSDISVAVDVGSWFSLPSIEMKKALWSACARSWCWKVNINCK